MTDLVWARSTMALSLGFHIIFASISMVLPFFMARAHWLYLRGGDPVYLRLTKAWSHGAAVLFATGAVSGTALSFQLGLLWPGFMEHAGPIIGMPFSLEGAAFFLEAIFLGLFLYGWKRLTPRAHFISGLMVGVCGLGSGVLVIAANGWMNSPTGFDWDGVHATNIQPWVAMFNRAWPLQALHMLVAAIQATSFAALGVHAFSRLRAEGKSRGNSSSESPFHREAMRVILPFAIAASLLQPLIGDLSAKSVAHRQPEKLAAFEAHFKTERGASLWVGGLPDEKTNTVRYGIAIPKGLSILAFADPEAEVLGLDAFPPENRPPVLLPHLAFQVMVGIGSLLLLFSLLWLAARRWRPSFLETGSYFKALVLLGPLGFVALEAGWIVTEVGRQPWVLYRMIRTADAVTPVPGLGVTFFTLAALYAFLGTFSCLVLMRLFQFDSRQESPISPLPKAAE
jgi:cytochrome bd ubiquinol oxidase subunit I